MAHCLLQLHTFNLNFPVCHWNFLSRNTPSNCSPAEQKERPVSDEYWCRVNTFVCLCLFFFFWTQRRAIKTFSSQGRAASFSLYRTGTPKTLKDLYLMSTSLYTLDQIVLFTFSYQQCWEKAKNVFRLKSARCQWSVVPEQDTSTVRGEESHRSMWNISCLTDPAQKSGASDSWLYM